MKINVLNVGGNMNNKGELKMTKDKIINEIKNQNVHLFCGIMLTWITHFFLPIWVVVFTGLVVGLISETIQFFFMDDMEWKIKDRILDSSFWAASSGIYYLLRVGG